MRDTRVIFGGSWTGVVAGVGTVIGLMLFLPVLPAPPRPCVAVRSRLPRPSPRSTDSYRVRPDLARSRTAPVSAWGFRGRSCGRGGSGGGGRGRSSAPPLRCRRWQDAPGGLTVEGDGWGGDGAGRRAGLRCRGEADARGPGLVVVAEGGRSAVGHRVVEVPGMASSCFLLLVPGALARPGRLAISPPRAFVAGAPDAAASDRRARQG
jgi:hypothetical protein